MQAALTRFAARLEPHKIPLLILTLAMFVGQFAVFHHHPVYAIFSGDSTDYINDAHKLLATGNPIDPGRTPGYPLLLAVIFGLTGGDHLKAVVAVQVVLMVSAIYLIYLLTFRLTRNRWAALIAGAFLALNTYLMNWEREILSETLALWLLVVAFIVTERYFHSPRPRYLILLTAVLIYSMFNRPFFVFLPALFFIMLFVHALRTGRVRLEWKPLAISAAISYALLGGFVLGNGLIYHYYGISYISSVNLFGKIIEYRMQTQFTDPRYTTISTQLNAWMAGGGVNQFIFLNHQYPQYARNYYRFASAYTDDIILHHPVEFTLYSLDDTYKAMILKQIYYDSHHTDPAWFAPVSTLEAVGIYVYMLLPFMLIGLAVWWWRQPKSFTPLLLLLLALTVMASLLEIGFASNGYPYRLRMPDDWAMIVLSVVMATSALQWYRQRQKPAAGSASSSDQERDQEMAPTQKRPRVVIGEAIGS